MTQSELNKEGITKEFLQKINVKTLQNPVQLEPNDEPVNLVKCGSGFWISINGEMLRDKTNNYLVISDKEAQIGRARYLLNFKEQVVIDKEAKEIKKEVDRLIQLTKNKIEDHLKKYKFLLQTSGLIETDVIHSLRMSIISESEIESLKTKAKELTQDEGYLKTYNYILNLYELKDWDNLYIWAFKDGVPEIASFENKDVDALIDNFHKNKIDKTLEKMKNSSYLENVARFNLAKKNSLK